MPSKDSWSTILLSALALAGGIWLGYADSRSDDVFITLGILIGFSFLLGVFGPRRPWLWPFLVSPWVPVLDIAMPRWGLAPQRPGESFSPMSALAVLGLVMAVSFAAAFAGSWLGRALRSGRGDRESPTLSARS